MSNVRLQGRPPLGCSCRRGHMFNGACATCRASAKAKGIMLLTPRQFQREKEDRQVREALVLRAKRDERRAKKTAAKAEQKARAALREERRRQKEERPKDPAVIFFEKHTPTILKESTPVMPRGDGILVVDSRGRVTDVKNDHVMTDQPPAQTSDLKKCPHCGSYITPRKEGSSTAMCPVCRYHGKRWRFR